jgi:iron complex outermembrane recepter protein
METLGARKAGCALMSIAVSAALLQANMVRAADEGVTGRSAEGSSDAQLPVVIVTGKRASLMSAQEIKRQKEEIVDSVVAEDIAKLPDVNVTEALQRITGVQITRDRGEGGTVAIRGLTQMETLLNGREIFTAGSGRNLEFSDYPAELVSGIDVFKTSSAYQIEGGIGGLINLRTRRPFDFAGREIIGSARVIHGDLVNETKPQFSVLASDRWKLSGGGEFGALMSLTHQKRAWREDQVSAGDPRARADIVPGQTVAAPNGVAENTIIGDRERTATNLVVQWRPSKELELYAEGSYAKFLTRQDSYQLSMTASPTFAAGSATLFPGTNDLRNITWTNVPATNLTFARDTLDRNKQLAVGGRWSRDALTVKADVSHTTSFNNLFFSGLNYGGRVANFTQDLSTTPVSSAISGTDLLNPANLQVASALYRARPFNGKLTAAQLDAEYELRDSFIEAIGSGVRFAKRRADNGSGTIFGDASISGVSLASRPGTYLPNPFGDYFEGKATQSIRDVLVADLSPARDAAGLRQSYGITAPLPVTGDPQGIWRVGEDTESLYLMARFKGSTMPLDGNTGVRVVHTSSTVAGNQVLRPTGTVSPLEIKNSYTDYLPSVNLRYQLHDGLYLRGAASKSITRQNFDQLSPSILLTPNTVNPSLNVGSAGNPELRPVRSNNLDIAIERYFNRVTSVYATAFLKKVDGFVTNVIAPEVHGGAVYQVTRPYNTDTAHIRGIELGYQQFFDFLPGWMSGLGIQANYTYVDSETPSTLVGGNAPLQGLSKNSANLVGMYERGRVSARVAYNWRDKFLSGVSNAGALGPLAQYTDGYGWLDASIGYRVTDKVTLALEGGNLLKTMRSSYYGVATRPQHAWLNDRQISLTATIRY